jgi:phenylalanyl-tRNA synthetase beta chain
MTGAREEMAWQGADTAPMDFYDLKGVVEALLAGLHLTNASFVPSSNPMFHPGRGAEVKLDDVGDWAIW